MNKRLISIVLLSLAAIAVVAAIGVYEFRAGVARGLAMGDKLPIAPGAWPYPFWYGPFHPFGFVFPLLFVFLIFAFARRLFWWGRSGGAAGWHPGSRDRFEEWHRKAHESMAESEPR